MEDTKVGDAGMKHLCGFRQLRELFIGNTAVAGPGVEALACLPKLETVSLDRSSITDAALGHLKYLVHLRELDLSGAEKLNGTGLAALKGLTNLAKLDFFGSGVDDNGMKGVLSLGRLKSLNLFGTKVTGAGLAQIAELSELAQLDLTGIEVSNAQLAPISKLAKLRTLCLDFTPITDAACESP